DMHNGYEFIWYVIGTGESYIFHFFLKKMKHPCRRILTKLIVVRKRIAVVVIKFEHISIIITIDGTVGNIWYENFYFFSLCDVMTYESLYEGSTMVYEYELFVFFSSFLEEEEKKVLLDVAVTCAE
ncbi:hypothetical protein ACJX0J_022673, partial [Zea mays]